MYAKIFQSIYDGTLGKDWHVRTVFQDFLILADKEGIVDMTTKAISRRTGVPLKIVLIWLLLPLHVLLNVVSIVWFALRGQGRVILRAKRDALFGLPVAQAAADSSDQRCNSA